MTYLQSYQQLDTYSIGFLITPNILLPWHTKEINGWDGNICLKLCKKEWFYSNQWIIYEDNKKEFANKYNFEIKYAIEFWEK